MRNELYDQKKFPCPVCAQICEIKPTKKNKPYYQCDACGIQVFVRGHEGIDLLANAVKEGAMNKILNSDDAALNSKLIKNNSRIYLINLMRIKLEKVPFPSSAIKSKLSELKLKIEQLENEQLQLLKN